ncbi:MAG: hypothetical protein Q9213_000509 [Squamulea squamosa]
MGSVINNTSNSGFLRMSEDSQLAYNVSKAAAVHVTRQLAYDLSHKKINVRVNGIAPGVYRRFHQPPFLLRAPSPQKSSQS